MCGLCSFTGALHKITFLHRINLDLVLIYCLLAVLTMVYFKLKKMITRVWSSDQITDPSIKEYWHFSFMSLSITDSMSSTARLILDTLDKMSTPIQVTTYNNTMLMNEIYPSLRYILVWPKADLMNRTQRKCQPWFSQELKRENLLRRSSTVVWRYV